MALLISEVKRMANPSFLIASITNQMLYNINIAQLTKLGCVVDKQNSTVTIITSTPNIDIAKIKKIAAEIKFNVIEKNSQD